MQDDAPSFICAVGFQNCYGTVSEPCVFLILLLLNTHKKKYYDYPDPISALHIGFLVHIIPN